RPVDPGEAGAAGQGPRRARPRARRRFGRRRARGRRGARGDRMSDSPIVLLPLLVLSGVVLFAFAGCGKPFTSGEPPTPTPPETYEGAIEATTGLVAYWRLGETKLPPDP